MIDLFEFPEDMPAKLAKVVNKWAKKWVDGTENYEDTAQFLNAVEKVGYTFDYGLDNEPFNLRAIPYYKLRSECFSDICQFLDRYGYMVKNYKIEGGNFIPDCEISFNSSETLGALIVHLNSLENCHVMMETIELFQDYTGIRKKRTVGQLVE